MFTLKNTSRRFGSDIARSETGSSSAHDEVDLRAWYRPLNKTLGKLIFVVWKTARIDDRRTEARAQEFCQART